MKENLVVNKGRYIYLDIIRLISCVLVISIHVSAMDWSDVSVRSLDWNIINIYNCIGINGVPLFFMISGALILNQEYQITYKKLFLDKIFKLLAAYYLTAFFYNLLPFFRGWIPCEPVFIKTGLIEPVIYEQGVYHLWFIPVLVVLYMLSPVLKEAFRSRKICEYYLILFIIIGATLPTILLFDFAPPLKHFLSYYEEKASLFMLTGYIGYFVLGHYIHSFTGELSKKKRIMVWIVTIAASVFTIVTCSLDAVRSGEASSLTNTPLSINVFLSCSGIYLLIKHYGAKITSERAGKVLGELSKYTLGIYLLHPFVIGNVSLITNLNQIFTGSFVLVGLRIFLVTLITFMIVLVLKKIPGIKRIL